MHLIEEHYSTFDVALSRAFGIWPYDRSRFMILRNAIVIIIIVSHVCLQLSVLFVTPYTLTLFARVMAFVSPCMMVIALYISLTLKLKTLRNLHNEIEDDWTLLRDKFEIDILLKNAHHNRSYIVIFFLYCVAVTVVVITIQLFPVMLDVVFPLNKSRPRELFIMVEYFAFHNKYFYTKVLHECVFIVVIMSACFAGVTRSFVLAVHALGMFKLARHRIEYSVEECVFHISNPKKEHEICKRIMYAVTAHRRAMEFSYVMVSSFETMYCSIVVLGVLAMSIDLYGVIDAITVSKNLDSLVVCISLATGVAGFLFLALSFDQKLTDSHDEIFHAVYATSWYLMPVSSQKLILNLLQKTGKQFYIKVGFVFASNIENFATLVNASLSYVALMYSIKQK